MKTLAILLASTSLLGACIEASDDMEDPDLEDADSKADGTTGPQVTVDQLNGQWLAGSVMPEMTIDSWGAIGIRIHIGANVVTLTRTGDQLTGDGVSLTIKPNKSGIRDDSMDGTINGTKVTLKRD